MGLGNKKTAEDLKAYLGEDVYFKGTLNFEGVVRIDGKFEGEVVTKDTLIVGESGELIAEVRVGTLICKGKIRGSILAEKRVEVHARSEVVGNIKAPSLYVEVGAVFNGSCDMSAAVTDAKILKLIKTDEKSAVS